MLVRDLPVHDRIAHAGLRDRGRRDFRRIRLDDREIGELPGLDRAAWLFSRIGPDLGLAINPGWEVGLEMATHGFAKFRKDFGLE